jgi:ribosomal protein S27E
MTQPNVIRIMCPNLSCQRILAVPSHARGRLVRCKSCATTIRIPVAKDKKPVPDPAASEDAPPA